MKDENETPTNGQSKHGGGPPKGSSNHLTNGHYLRKKLLAPVSWNDFNQRIGGSGQMETRRMELIEHRGGKENQNAVMDSVIMQTCFQEYIVAHLDHHCAELGPNIVDKDTHSPLPILAARTREVHTLLTLYDKIGYQPTARNTSNDFIAACAEVTRLDNARIDARLEAERKANEEQPNTHPNGDGQ